MISMMIGQPGESRLAGFKIFWAVYVQGFDPRFHCKKSLLGVTSRYTRPYMALPRDIHFDETTDYRFLYLCGVSEGFKYQNNFHLALFPEIGAIERVETYKGGIITVIGGKMLPIDPLPDGFGGLGRAYTTCRNYQFGVQYFLEGKPGILTRAET